MNKITLFRHAGLWFLFIIIFEVITGFIGRGQSFIPIHDFILMFVKCFILTVIVYNKWRGELRAYMIGLHIFYGFFIAKFLIDLFVFDYIKFIGWYNMALAILGCWAGYYFSKSLSTISKTTIIVISLVLLAISLNIENNITQFNGHRNFTGMVEHRITRNTFDFLDRNNQPLIMAQDRLYVMDLWNTACGYCIKAFPKFNQLIQGNDRKDIEFLSVNFPIDRDSINQAYYLVKQKGYSFPVYKATASTREALGIRGFPTYVAFKNDTMVFKGTIELLEDYIEKY